MSGVAYRKDEDLRRDRRRGVSSTSHRSILEGRRGLRACTAVEAQGGRGDPRGEPTLRPITRQNYFRLRKLSGIDRYRADRGDRVHEDLYEIPVVEIPTTSDSVRTTTTRYSKRRRQVESGARGNSSAPRSRSRSGRDRLGRGLGDDLRGASARGIKHAVLKESPRTRREGERSPGGAQGRVG